MNILQLVGVTKVYHSQSGPGSVKALEAVDLRIDPGDFVAFVGPSGCGKSTLLNIVAALIRPTRGQVLFEGRPLHEPSREMGVMFQAPVLLPWRTVERNVLLPAEVFGISGEEIRARVHEVLELVGLSEFMKAHPHQLSGGMQQRVALARVLAYEPKVLLMDEPFGALDEFTREAMNLELMRITRPSGITVLFVTHNINEAVFLADRVVVMTSRPGRVSGVVAADLGKERDIEVMREQVFTDLTFEVRGLLKG
jgi:NitT/TauT family transport system ATP-binding protein